MKFLTDDDRSLLGAAISFIKTSDLSYNALDKLNGVPLVDELIKMNKSGIDFGYLCDALLKGEAENLKLSELARNIKNQMREDRTKNKLDDELILGNKDQTHKPLKDKNEAELSLDEQELLNSLDRESFETLKNVDSLMIKKLFKYKEPLMAFFDTELINEE